MQKIWNPPHELKSQIQFQSNLCLQHHLLLKTHNSKPGWSCTYILRGHQWQSGSFGALGEITKYIQINLFNNMSIRCVSVVVQLLFSMKRTGKEEALTFCPMSLERQRFGEWVNYAIIFCLNFSFFLSTNIYPL